MKTTLHRMVVRLVFFQSESRRTSATYSFELLFKSATPPKYNLWLLIYFHMTNRHHSQTSSINTYFTSIFYANIKSHCYIFE